MRALRQSQTLEILGEGPSRTNPARMLFVTPLADRVDFLEHARVALLFDFIGDLDVKITRAGSFTLYGDPAIVNLD